MLHFLLETSARSLLHHDGNDALRTTKMRRSSLVFAIAGTEALNSKQKASVVTPQRVSSVVDRLARVE